VDHAAGLDLLNELAVILAVAAVTTVLFQRIHQPVVLGYLLAGLIVGPHLPVPLFADETLAHQMSELGVILLMFSLGLEFSLRNLVRVGPTAGLVAVIQCSLMIWLGYACGRLFGWTGLESLFCGALIAISSTTIIVKAFAEQGLSVGRGAGADGRSEGARLAEIVFGILIVEDLIAILLLAVLTPVASGASLSAGALAMTVAKLAAFLVGMLVVGILVVPRLVRLIVKLGRTETTVVACVGLCFVGALLARKFGYSVALGAFLAGALVAESGEAKSLEHLVEPVRDVFAAVFFVSVGMLIDPYQVIHNWKAVLVLTAVVIAGKVVGVAVGAFLAGHPVRTSVRAGMSLAQIGEFSFIIAGVGVGLGAIGKHIYPIAVAVSAITTLVTPWLIRWSGRAGAWVDRRLPHPLQTFVSLYGSWVQNLRQTREHHGAWARIRRLAGLLLVDVLAIGAVVIAASLGMWRLVVLGSRLTSLREDVVRWLVVLAAAALAAPFVLGAVRVARALGAALAAEALPEGAAGLDLAAAPRRALLVALQLAIVIVAGVPLAALTQPFLPGFPVIAVFLLLVLLLVIPLWRSATNLHGHVRAGAQVILEALARQTQQAATGGGNGGHAAPAPADVRQLVPGLGDPATIVLAAGAPAVGQTLKALNLRGQTGATVIAIDRGPADIVYPTAEETLREGDVLVLTGSHDAVSAARDLLLQPAPGAPAREPAPPGAA
jgi:monovalent cation:H+ antiporter-2, CPA2 family